MTHVINGRLAGDAGRSKTFGVADWLHLAATPTFAVMALLTATIGSETTCMGMTGSSPFGSMSLMYLLMAVFHVTPWVKTGNFFLMKSGQETSK